MKSYYWFYLLLILFLSCSSPKNTFQPYQTEGLKIEQLTPHTYLHVSYLKTKSFGNVPCNGMIVTDGREAIVYDTPTNDSISNELINWIESNLKCKVKAVVTTHFHVDCLGGLAAFHKKGIASYANQHTIDLAKTNNEALPQNGFETSMELSVGNKKVVHDFLGEGHTKDNIVSYFPNEKVMFGGCLIKSLKSGKGNLADANVEEWANTVKKVKAKYPDALVVIPGHGKVGGIDLLDYTIEKFKL